MKKSEYDYRGSPCVVSDFTRPLVGLLALFGWRITPTVLNGDTSDSTDMRPAVPERQVVPAQVAYEVN